MKYATVRDYMTTDVVAVRPNDSFKEIVRVLADRGVSGAPVVDETGGVIGVVSEADLLHKEAFKPFAEEVRQYFASRSTFRAAEAKAAGDTAAELMSVPAVTVTSDAPIALAARIMATHGVKRLPVVGADGALVGIISRADAVSVFLMPDHQIRQDVISKVVECSLWLPSSSIGVEVSNGVVTLSGQLRSESLIPIAVALTRSIDGVVDVINRLSYEGDGMTSERPQHRH